MKFLTPMTMFFAAFVLFSSQVLGQPALAVEYNDALTTADKEGWVRIMVTLQYGPSISEILAEGSSPDSERTATAIRNVREKFIERIAQQNVTVVRVFEETPTVVVDATPDAITSIMKDELVTEVTYLPSATDFSSP